MAVKPLEDRQSAFLLEAQKSIPQYANRDTADIRQNIADVFSSNDETRIGSFMTAMQTQMPAYRNRELEEIQVQQDPHNMSARFQHIQGRVPAVRIQQARCSPLPDAARARRFREAPAFRERIERGLSRFMLSRPLQRDPR